MTCDSRASLLARNLASPCLGHEPKVRVTTSAIPRKFRTIFGRNYLNMAKFLEKDD
jgi:hypothetical protein